MVRIFPKSPIEAAKAKPGIHSWSLLVHAGDAKCGRDRPRLAILHRVVTSLEDLAVK
jgi:hypothetical protein|tara:strand:+ start:263 stop:433 length:171 start_codon:yes stop_codon:yes gene_type:complete